MRVHAAEQSFQNAARPRAPRRDGAEEAAIPHHHPGDGTSMSLHHVLTHCTTSYLRLHRIAPYLLCPYDTVVQSKVICKCGPHRIALYLRLSVRHYGAVKSDMQMWSAPYRTLPASVRMTLWCSQKISNVQCVHAQLTGNAYRIRCYAWQRAPGFNSNRL